MATLRPDALLRKGKLSIDSLVEGGGRLTPEQAKRFIEILVNDKVLLNTPEIAASCLYWYQHPFRRWLIDWTQGARVLPFASGKLKGMFR